MKTWSKIRDKLENEYLAEPLRGHIQYFVTTYNKSHDREGRAAIRFDGKEILKSNYYEWAEKSHEYYHQPSDAQTWQEHWAQVIVKTENAGAFDQGSFYDAFAEFDHQSIEASLSSERMLVKLFALMDRRVGKRRLERMREEMEHENEIVKLFYFIRMKAEGLITE